MLPDQMLTLFDMMVFDFIPGACFFVVRGSLLCHCQSDLLRHGR